MKRILLFILAFLCLTGGAAGSQAMEEHTIVSFGDLKPGVTTATMPLFSFS